MSASAANSFEGPTDIEARLKRLRHLANLLDNAFTIPGTKFRIGLDPIIGLIPGAGDLITSLISLYIIIEARKLGAPRSTRTRMLLNVGIDFLVGTIPLLGDIFDAGWKCNVRNLRILERAMQRASP